jgi:hypothetical protein
MIMSRHKWKEDMLLKTYSIFAFAIVVFTHAVKLLVMRICCGTINGGLHHDPVKTLRQTVTITTTAFC